MMRVHHQQASEEDAMRGIVRLKRFMVVALLLAASNAAPAQAPRVDRDTFDAAAVPINRGALPCLLPRSHQPHLIPAAVIPTRPTRRRWPRFSTSTPSSGTGYLPIGA